MHIARIKNKVSFMLGLLIMFTAVSVWQACSSEDETVGKPIITGFTPSDGGPVGTVVKINGSFFSTLTSNKVMFNGVEGEVISATTTSIKARVPEGASTGAITVSVDGHEGNSPSVFTVTNGTPAPAIVSFTPTAGNGADKDSVFISGFNFSPVADDNIVTFNGVQAATLYASSTLLKVKVPAGARTGKITVETNGLTGTSDSDFAVATPTVTLFTPDNTVVGGTIMIKGTNFSTTSENNVVTFNGLANTAVDNVQATEVTWVKSDIVGESLLMVKVPVGAITGTVSVSVDGVTGTSEKPFTVN
jgi:hypothetical protein